MIERRKRNIYTNEHVSTSPLLIDSTVLQLIRDFSTKVNFSLSDADKCSSNDIYKGSFEELDQLFRKNSYLIYTSGSKYEKYVDCAVVCAELQFLINTESEVSVLSSKQDEKKNSFDLYYQRVVQMSLK